VCVLFRTLRLLSGGIPMRPKLMTLSVGCLVAALAACGGTAPVASAPPPSGVAATGLAATPAGGPAGAPAAAAATSGPAIRPAIRPAMAVAQRVAFVRRPASPPFATPQAAMRYLARAYNTHDMVALRHVTTPSARQALLDMRVEAVNLRLDGCERQPAGDYLCTFTHDYPRAMHRKPTEHGASTFLVAPALRPGWYMTVLEGCG